MTGKIRSKHNTLVIDDVRTMKFAATYARNLDDAKNLLNSQAWDEVWLDHDLDFSLANAEAYFAIDYTVRPLVLQIAEDAQEGRTLDVGMFVVHTGNHPGKMWIAGQLLPWYTVGVTKAQDWTRHETYPQWARYILDGEDDEYMRIGETLGG